MVWKMGQQTELRATSCIFMDYKLRIVVKSLNVCEEKNVKRIPFSDVKIA